MDGCDDRMGAFRRGGRGWVWWRRWRWVPSAIALALMLPPMDAGAKVCGDKVEGVDVPCECGDILVSDLTLADDPVASHTCPRDALIVRAPEAKQPLTIDLAGRALRGSGHGVGIWLFQGGGAGARIVSTGGAGVIEGFRDGIIGQGPSSVSLVDGITVQKVKRDGVRLFDVKTAEIRNSTVTDAGRDGFWVSGTGYRLTGNRALRSRRVGYHLMGADAVIGIAGAGNVAESNGTEGFSVMGRGHRLVECVATRSGQEGMKINGVRYEIVDCRAQDNGGDGIAGRGMEWRVAGTKAIDNDNNGLAVSGRAIVDVGGNVGSGNRGRKQRRPVVQCRLGEATCTP